MPWVLDTVNTIDDIKELFCGKAAVDFDIDRQDVTLSGLPYDIGDWIREAVVNFHARRGGLSLIFDLYSRIPFEIIKAVRDSLETAYRGDLHEQGSRAKTY